MPESASGELTPAEECCCYFQVVAQRRFQLIGRAEAGLAEDLADASVEALHDAVSPWMAERNEAVLNLVLFALDMGDELHGGIRFPSSSFLLRNCPA